MTNTILNTHINDWFVESQYGIKHKMMHYNVICKCGTKKIKCMQAIKKNKACFDCVRSQQILNVKHNACSKKSDPLLYKTYMTRFSMIRRCKGLTPKDKKNYLDRNITVCQRWLDSFENFLEDMGKKPENCSIDRIDNNKGYFKENCRWVTDKVQCNNTRKNIFHTYLNETLTEAQWAEKFDITLSKTRHWISKKGIEFFVTNIEKIKQISNGTTNEIFQELDLEQKGAWKKIHGAFSSTDPSLLKTYKSWEFIKNHKAGVLGWTKFEDFLHDMGKKPLDCFLARLDITKAFSKDNCIWKPTTRIPTMTKPKKRILFTFEEKIIENLEQFAKEDNKTVNDFCKEIVKNWVLDKLKGQTF